MIYICKIGTTYGNKSPAVCRAMFTQLLNARLTDSPVQMRFAGYTTCADIVSLSNVSALNLTGLTLKKTINP